MTRIGPDDVGLTMDELRVVARYAAASAEEVLPLFEKVRADDRRPRVAVEAAWSFVDGANRSNVQRVTSLDAHRAAMDARSGPARHAAHAAGDAAAAAYLHPPQDVLKWRSNLARSSQVGHIVRAAAHAAHAAELSAGEDSRVGDRHIERAWQRATPELADIVRRYPPASVGKNRVTELMHVLDAALRKL